jgi:hypothetical protein
VRQNRWSVCLGFDQGLERLAAPGISVQQAQQAAKDAAQMLQRAGLRGSALDMLRALCGRLVPSLLSPEQLAALLDLAVAEEETGGGGAFSAAVLDLVVAAAAAAPGLFAAMLARVAALLEKDDVQLTVVVCPSLPCCPLSIEPTETGDMLLGHSLGDETTRAVGTAGIRQTHCELHT